MKIVLYNIGKTEAPYLRTGVEEYIRRISHFIDFSVVDLPSVKHGKNLTSDVLCKKEGEMLLHALTNSGFIILLDEKGKEYSSRSFSEYLNRIMNQGVRQISFVTGGAYGFSKEVYAVAQHKFSLSQMTFTHQIVRLVFLEQLYRAFTLIKGIPYHNDQCSILPA
jgi:23S rRNA (pseudouridine1915-N3)-methyltransferase